MRLVQKIDGFAIKQAIIENPVGRELYCRKEVGRIEYPNFSFTIPECRAERWLAYWKRFVGEGQHGGDAERGGILEYLSSDLRTTLLEVRFAGLGVTGLTFDKHEAGSDRVRNLKVGLYCENVTPRQRS
jgi:hypothetical protein